MNAPVKAASVIASGPATKDSWCRIDNAICREIEAIEKRTGLPRRQIVETFLCQGAKMPNKQGDQSVHHHTHNQNTYNIPILSNWLAGATFLNNIKFLNNIRASLHYDGNSALPIRREIKIGFLLIVGMASGAVLNQLVVTNLG